MLASRKRLLLASAALASVVVALSAPGSVRAQDPSPSPSPDGRDLFLTSCASCHGAEGAGTDLGPSLEDAGAAAADFQLSTGRMPLADADGPDTPQASGVR